jgi:hypothetical protein
MSKTHTPIPTSRTAKSKPATKKNIPIAKAIARVWECAMEMYEKNDPNQDGPPPFRLQMGLRTIGLDAGLSDKELTSALGE